MASNQHHGIEEFQKAIKHQPTAELLTAVREGDEAGVRSALDRGARSEVTIPTNAGVSGSLLTLAVSKGYDHLLPHLLKAGLSIEDGGTTDVTPLMVAAGTGHTQTVKALLDLGGNPLATNNIGRTALHFAAGGGHQQCVAALIPVTPPTPAHIEAHTPVHAASYNGYLEVLEQLAGAGWPLTARDSYGDTPMHCAAAGGSVTCLQWLVQRGGDPSVQNNAGLTPLQEELITAVGEGDEARVRSALDKGARPEVTVPTDDGVSASLLTLAASKGHDHLLPHLLQAGLSIEGGGTIDKTPLMVAAWLGHTQTVKALLDLGGNPLATNGEGCTAINYAAGGGHKQCVAALMPVTPPTPAHLQVYTPVHAASYTGHMEVLEQLADAGWSLTARDSAGNTPMHCAAAGGSVTCMQWLVQRGGDPSMQNNAGHTPLDKDLIAAVREGDEARVRLALDRGARPEVNVPTNAGVSGSLLTLAASEGHDHLLPHLLQAGLSIEGEGTTDMTPLMVAAGTGHTQTVKALLDLGGNPLATNDEAWGHQQCVAALMPITPPTPAHLQAYTPVHVASYKGHMEVLEQLVGAGWPLTSRDSNGNTPMHCAAAGGNVTCLQWLEERGGDPSVQNNAGHTPLDKELVTAVRDGDEARVRSALHKGARPEVTVPTNTGVPGNLLILAASNGHDHLLPHLLQAGLGIEDGGTTDMTPLMVAAQLGHTQTVKVLLDLGGNPLATNSTGWTALHFAAGGCHQQCVAALIPVTHPTPEHLEVQTPVHAASYNGHVEVLEQLANAGWPLTSRDSDGNTSMHYAVAGGSMTCLQWLVQRGGDPSVQNKAGHTPLDKELITAVREGDEVSVRSALDKGARLEVTVPTNAGMSMSLLTLAAIKGHDHLLPILVQAGLSIEGGGTTDMTPLMEAAQRGHTQTVKVLLDLGGNPLATNGEGWTALHFAAWGGHQQCVAALIPVTPPTPAHIEADTPVHAASYNGHVKVLEQLANAGWPLTARDSDGNTPIMHCAADWESVTCLQWLVQRGGYPSVQNKLGRTPLDKELITAVGEGDEARVRSVLDKGARPEVTVPFNAEVSGSLLTLAASKGHDHLLPHLLQAGLSIEGGGTIDKTPLTVAAWLGHTQTVKALLDLGGNPLATNGEDWHDIC
ncbi:serine/threonine-protein phosphatase 6 regulatory ankyrin repeat subunit B-like isoform X2 [Scylla paramamosain]|uniref:serine/threonine-protein phosphatase 6 regulatory ankyrin repeat subunit B-like isoform X2 n=1 Tax=Scylla paramamosain TaxID=85552 RepID=UPI003083CFBD